jgi:hypothetical protein
MFQVTEKATEVIKEFLQNKAIQTIRIIMTAG